jgi:ADP-ribose pyrophosphatase YjhB (NUDIX family)
MSRKRRIGPVVETVPDGDNRSRLVCPDCGYIEYDNPKIIVGAVCVWRDQVLLCRRAIEPRVGFWTIPAGFMELNETTGQGAAREVWEEARARVEVTGLIGIYEIPHISQVYVIHEARMTEARYSVGEESQEVDLFAWERIPWDELAFPSVAWALERFRRGAAPGVQVALPGK